MWLLLLVFWTSMASADAVPWREDCPPGTRPASGHWGAHCLPAECVEMSSCPVGTRCATVGLCMMDVRVVGEDVMGPFESTRRVVVGACTELGPCEPTLEPVVSEHGHIAERGAASCELDRRCVVDPPAPPPAPPVVAPAPAPVPPAPSAGVGCAASGRSSRIAPALLLASLVLAHRRRRRR